MLNFSDYNLASLILILFSLINSFNSRVSGEKKEMHVFIISFTN